jgi:hypothetical protein
MQSNNSKAINETSSSIPSPDTFLILFSLVGYTYLTTIISVIGFVLNIITLLVLASPSFKGDTYKYLIFKTTTHLSVMTFGAFVNPLVNCPTCMISLTYTAQVFRILCISFFPGIASTCAALVEIALSHDRLLMFDKKTNCVSFTFASSFISLFGIVISLPYLFSFKIVNAAPGFDVYLTTRNDFGNSAFYRIYIAALNFFQSFISFIIMIVLNITVTIKFKKYIKRKANLTKSTVVTVKNATLETSNQAKIEMTEMSEIKTNQLREKEKATKNQKEAAELNFTLMIIVSSLIFIISRLIQFSFSLTIQILPLFGVFISSSLNIYIVFAGQIVTIVYYALNPLTYVLFNKVFNAHLKKLFHIC